MGNQVNHTLEKLREIQSTPEGQASLELEMRKFIAREQRSDTRAIKFWSSKRAEVIRVKVKKLLEKSPSINSGDLSTPMLAPNLKSSDFDDLVANGFSAMRKLDHRKIFRDESIEFDNENFVENGLKYTLIFGLGCAYRISLAENEVFTEKKSDDNFIHSENTAQEFLLNRGFREIEYGVFLDTKNISKVCLKPDGIYGYTHSLEHGDYLEMHLNFIPEVSLLAHLLKKTHLI